jgi:ribosomal protein L1
LCPVSGQEKICFNSKIKDPRIDNEEKTETFNGTVSLPFIPGKAVAVKIIDARGIESLKIIRL